MNQDNRKKFIRPSTVKQPYHMRDYYALVDSWRDLDESKWPIEVVMIADLADALKEAARVIVNQDENILALTNYYRHAAKAFDTTPTEIMAGDIQSKHLIGLMRNRLTPLLESEREARLQRSALGKTERTIDRMTKQKTDSTKSA